jgi:hypothetical protein
MTSALKFALTAFEQAAGDLISLMIHSADVCARVEYEFDVRADYMPSYIHFQAYIAIQTLRKLGRKGSLNDNAVIELTGATVTHDWYNLYYARGVKNNTIDAVLMAHLADNARIVRDNGKVKVLYEKLTAEANLLQAGQSFDDTLINSMNALAMAGTNQAIGDEHAVEHGAFIEDMLNNEPPPAFYTGINAIDDLTGGIGFKRLSSLISAYKMRKTTSALNIVLGVLMTNPDARAAFYSAEMNQIQVALNMIAMLAIAWLLKRGLYTPESSMIWGDLLQQVGNGYKHWKNHRAEAVNEGIKAYKALGNRLQIYDKNVGGLRTMADAERLFRRNVALFGGDFHVFDYFGLLEVSGASLFEQSATRTQRFLEMSKDKSILVLAQKNEANVERTDGHSAGSKGGNDLPAASSYVWTTRYNAKETPNILTLELKHSRFSEVRAMDLGIHPPSGLLLENSWVGRL